jgi:hypothetical protein
MSDWLPFALAIAFVSFCYITARLVSLAYFQEKLTYHQQLLKKLTTGDKTNG